MNKPHFNIKPNLVDPIIEQNLIKKFNPPKEDYWGPTKQSAGNIYKDYVRPNYLLIVLFILFILFLVYRYRIIRQKRPPVQAQSKTNSEYEQLLLDLLRKHQEDLREPIQPESTRMKPAKIAYPTYPSSPKSRLT